MKLEAMQLTRKNADEVFKWIGLDNISESNNGEFAEDSCYCKIKNSMNKRDAVENDYIIKDNCGRFSVCVPEVMGMLFNIERMENGTLELTAQCRWS